MSAQDNMEKVLRELHVLLSKSNPYERDSNYLVVNKKEMLDVLKQLAVCMSEVMDEYELTKQGREQAQRENRKIGEEIINDARAKAEDVYAASVMYTDEALRRILDIMDEANESVKAVYDSMGEKLANERKLVSGDKLELKSLLQDLKDTDKYMGIIEERNKKIAKEKKWKEEDTESSPYAAVKPEIKINRDYFEQQGISFEEPEEEQPEKKSNPAGMLLVVLLVAGLGGGAFYYFKVMKPKQSVKGGTDLEDFDIDEYDEDEQPEADDGSPGEQEDETEDTL